MVYRYYKKRCHRGPTSQPFVRFDKNGSLHLSKSLQPYLPFGYKDFVMVGIDKQQNKIRLDKKEPEGFGCRRICRSNSTLYICLAKVLEHFGISPTHGRIYEVKVGDDYIEFCYA